LWSTFQVKQTTGFYPRLKVDTRGRTAVGQAGGVLLCSTVRAAGLDGALSDELARWRKPMARHDPAKAVLDLVIALALGGDACSDLAVVRAEPAVFGPVASGPTLSRMIATLAGDADRALGAIARASAMARARVWALAGAGAPDHDVSADANGFATRRPTPSMKSRASKTPRTPRRKRRKEPDLDRASSEPTAPGLDRPCRLQEAPLRPGSPYDRQERLPPSAVRCRGRAARVPRAMSAADRP
jgi:hypothetical protein